MNYRGPGFLAYEFARITAPHPPFPSKGDTDDDWDTCWRERGERVGEEPVHTTAGKKVWSSVNHSILSADQINLKI